MMEMTHTRGKSLERQNAFNGSMSLVERESALGGTTFPMGPAYQHIIVSAVEWSCSVVVTVNGPSKLCSLL